VIRHAHAAGVERSPTLAAAGAASIDVVFGRRIGIVPDCLDQLPPKQVQHAVSPFLRMVSRIGRWRVEEPTNSVIVVYKRRLF